MKLLFLLFRAIDVDKSGTLEREEFVTGVEALNRNLPEGRRIVGEDVNALFDKLDEDGDGKVNIDEWKGVEKFIL